MISYDRMIRYREWTGEDAPALREMVGALHEAMRPYDENYPPASAIIEEYFRYLMDTVAETAGTFFLAEDEGKPVGMACVFGLMTPFSPDEDPALYSFVSDLYVDTAYRGHGVGAELLAHAEIRARALGAPRLELAVHAANPAMTLYTRQGFRQRLIIMTKRLTE